MQNENTNFMKLKREGNNYFTTSIKKFIPLEIEEDIITKSFEFAYEMAFGNGYHRNHRSGGQAERTPADIFCNTLQGKIAEIVVYDFFLTKGLHCEPLDFSINGKGVWDEADLVVNKNKISIKSTGHFSNLLLLETKDWDMQGSYIPNNCEGSNIYDYFILVRIKPNTISFRYAGDFEKSSLLSEILAFKWYYEIAGCCSKKTLEYIINENYIIPKNSLLNGKTKMDAENYYIQAGELKDINQLIHLLKKQ